MEQGRPDRGLAKIAETVAMSDGDMRLDEGEGDEAGRWFCVVTRGDLEFRVELEEPIPGSGDRRVVGVEIRAREGTLTAGALRDAPYGDLMRTARAKAEKLATGDKPRVLARPSDPPVTFRADRRGRASRTERDYALLALSYLAMGPEVRPHAAATWAHDFPEGGTKRTWLNRLVKAKRFVEGDRLTDKGMTLVHGVDWVERFEVEEKWDNALNLATMTPGGRIWRQLQSDGQDPRRWAVHARRALGVRVDDQGHAFPINSPQTPDECGE